MLVATTFATPQLGAAPRTTPRLSTTRLQPLAGRVRFARAPVRAPRTRCSSDEGYYGSREHASTALVRVSESAARSLVTMSPSLSPSLSLVPAPAPAPPAPPPPRPAVLYVLTGGGSGVGKRALSGCRATYVRPGNGNFGWCKMRLAGRGNVVNWSRVYMRQVLANGRVADAPPSWDDLERGKQPAQPLPPQPAASAAVVAVLFDLESVPCATSATGWRITELAAVSQIFDGDSWRTGSHFAAYCADAGEFATAGTALLAWLAALPGGGDDAAPVIALAHNGHRWDWPLLERSMQAVGLTLRGAVTRLDCSRAVFVAEKARELGTKWSMARIFAARFGGAAIPNAHTATGDVRAMELIFADVARAKGGAWLRSALLFSETAKQPQDYVSGDDADADAGERSAAPPAAPAAVALLAEPATVTPLPSPLAEPSVQRLTGLLTRLVAAPRSRDELAAAVRVAAALPAVVSAAAPSLERAARADRSLPLVWAARALGALAQRALPALERALSEAA